MKLRMLFALLAVSALAGAAEAAPRPTPDWGSDRILAARPIAPVAVIAFSLHRDITGDKAQSDDTAVLLGPDFTATTTGTAHTVDDFALCRQLGWSDGGMLANDSCYTDPGFRAYEIINRRQMNAILAAGFDKGQAPSDVASLYWSEQELATQEKPSSPLTERKTGAGDQFLLDGKVVVTLGPTGFAFTSAERPEIARFLARHLDLHPQVRAAILASGVLPAIITQQRQGMDGTTTETLTFSAQHRDTAAYPLPPGLASQLVAQSQGSDLEAAGLRTTIAAMAGGAPPSYDDLLASFRAEAAAGHDMRAYLIANQLLLQYGGMLDHDPAKMQALRDIAGADLQKVFSSPATAAFVQASELAGNARPTPDNEAAAKYLAGATELDAMPFGTFRYITFANLVSNSDTDTWDPKILAAMPSVEDCFWKHIAAYPWTSSVFKDLGNRQLSGYQTDKAWQAWDLGRAVDPQAANGAIADVARLEAWVRAGNPDAF